MPETLMLSAGKLSIPVQVEHEGRKLALLFRNYAPLREEVKCMRGAEFKPDPPRWLVTDCARNRAQLSILRGEWPFPRTELPLLGQPRRKTLMAHQTPMFQFLRTRRRAILAAEMGTMKTLPTIEVMEEVGGDWYYVAPKKVLDSIKLEFAKWKATIEPEWVSYHMLRKTLERWPKNKKAPRGVVFDECFAAGTLVDTPGGRKAIEKLRVGDTILNAVGADTISGTHRREVFHAVAVSFAGKRIICSPNHPWLTSAGWVAAQDLEPGDTLVSQRAAMLLVRGDFRTQDQTSSHPSPAEVLREILLSEMAHERPGTQDEMPHARGQEEARGEGLTLVPLGQPIRQETTCLVGSTVPSAQVGRDVRQDLPRVENHAPQTFRAWGERSWFDQASTDLAGCSRVDLGAGICFVSGQAHSQLSQVLQDRLSRARAESSYRGGWILPLSEHAETSRREEDGEAMLSRVDRLEVLQPGNPELERFRAEDGKLYFYDLGGTQHPSFSVAGRLVHNSSFLKNGGTGWTEAAQYLADRIREEHGDEAYIILLTGSPAPKDPVDWHSQVEITCPGFLRESTAAHLRRRLAVIDSSAGFPKITGWRMEEVERLERRLRGLVHVVFSKDCQSLPELRVEYVDLKPSPETLRAARIIANTATNAVGALNLIRQLSDGFQYVPGGDVLRAESPKDAAVAARLARNEDVGRVVIYAPYTESVDRCVSLCIEQGWRVLRCDGRGWSISSEQGVMVPVKDPSPYLKQMDRSQDVWTETRFARLALVAHPKSGGFGANFTAARETFYYSCDFDWNSHVQSTKRVHRHGVDPERGACLVYFCHLPTDRYVIANHDTKRNLQAVSLGEIRGVLS